MKKILVFVITFISLIPTAWCSHMAGGNFEYECLGSNQYLIRFIFYRDCDGIHPENSYPLWLESESCDISCYQVGTIENVSHEYVDYGCGNTCIASSKPGFQRYVFEETITLPSECPDWKVSIIIGDRNFTDYANGGAYVNYCLINNTGGICNNSPTFSDLGVWLGCIDTYTEFNNLHSEADGDLLVFELISPLTGLTATTPPCLGYGDLGFVSPLTWDNPFPSLSGFSINSSTGVMNFTPTHAGTSYFAVKVSEYRSGVLISESIRDGEIIVRDDCEPSPDITLSNWIESGDTDIEVVPLTEGCYHISIVSSDPIIDIEISGLPTPQFDWTMTGVGTPNVTIEICPVWDAFDGFCDPQSFSFSLTATKEITGCYDEGGSVTAGYNFLIPKIDWCPEYRYFTNRGPVLPQLPLPAVAKATIAIYFGDVMPPGGPPPSEWGPVYGSGDHYFEAPIITTTCASGGDGCVVFTSSGGGTTVLKYAEPLCSPDCPVTPLDINVTETFECDNERISVEVLSGEPPYFITWYNETGEVLGIGPEVNVHDLVKDAIWEPGVNYTLYVEDITGSYTVYHGNLRGTERFYRPIIDGMHGFSLAYEDNLWCSQDSPYPDSVYLYNINCCVYDSEPFFVYDEVNSPPYYGATIMNFKVFDGYGAIVNEIDIDLNNTDDWSIDENSIYWDGTFNNTGSSSDCAESPADVFQYTLYAKNCTTNPHCEQDKIVSFECYYGDWNDSIIHVKSSDGGADTGMENVGSEYSRPAKENINGTANGVKIYPNPTDNILYIETIGMEIEKILIYDASGKIVLKEGEHFSEIKVGQFDPGCYDVKIITSAGLETKKLIVY